jgi:transposase-like protein
LRAIATTDSRAEACARKAAWVKKYRRRRPEAVARLEADWERMLSLYSFPEEHWPHLRNTAVVESLLSELRLYTNLSKAQPRTPNGRAILWKLLLVGAQGLRKINSPQLLPAVAAAETCVDGEFVAKARRRAS